MSNPWTKKNPLMSMWMSAANKAAGPARATATAAVKRQAATSQADVARQIIDLWRGTARPTPTKKKRR